MLWSTNLFDLSSVPESRTNTVRDPCVESTNQLKRLSHPLYFVLHRLLEWAQARSSRRTVRHANRH